MSEEINQSDLPSLETTNQLFVDLNVALEKFLKANPDVNTSLVFITAIRAMLVFPLTWMQNSGKSDLYLDVMDDHIKAVYAASIINDKLNQTE